MTVGSPHTPVLLAEVIDVLDPKDGGLYVDGTFGAGGYSRAILAAADCAVIGIDRDPSAIARGQGMLDDFPGRLTLIQGCFGDMEELLAAHGVAAVDGIALDIGVSSMQIDEPERGFSFSKDGPLDMRMGGEGQSAADVVNLFEEEDLRQIISVYGEERRARLVARAIVEAREEKPFTRTGEFSELLEKTIFRRPQDKIHVATRTFQGLRIYVNDELGELIRALEASERLLKPTGRLAVVAFHSLEDRIVKRFLASRSGRTGGQSRHMPLSDEGKRAPTFELLQRKVVKAGSAEVDENPRARSARLRGAVRAQGAPWPQGVFQTDDLHMRLL